MNRDQRDDVTIVTGRTRAPFAPHAGEKAGVGWHGKR